MPPVSADDLTLPPPAEGSAEIAARIAKARRRQRDRYGAHGSPLRTNAEAEGDLLEAIAAPDVAGRALLKDATDKLRLTARGYHRVLKVARTLADLQGAEDVLRSHVAEALAYRQRAAV